MQDFDKLWNYKDPAATEVEFRKILNEPAAAADLNYKLQLLTQIGRTYSLRGMFSEAHTLLDHVNEQLPGDSNLAHVRYHLERGRTFNSSGKTEEAKRHFTEAKNLAAKLGEDVYTIDAIHMLANIAPPMESVQLNEEALMLAESSSIEKAKLWLGTLYNNLGWSYFDGKAYDKALTVFLRALKWQEERNPANGVFIAKWSVARTMRALNRPDDALKIQLALLEEMTKAGNDDGYVHEELGELYLEKNEKQKSASHFQKAYKLLSGERHLQQFETARLERMKDLSV